MFHDGHQLNRIITLTFDARYNIFSEIFVGRHFEFWTCDTDMAFVDLDVFRYFRFLVLKLILLWRIPEVMLVHFALIGQYVVCPW